MIRKKTITLHDRIKDNSIDVLIQVGDYASPADQRLIQAVQVTDNFGTSILHYTDEFETITTEEDLDSFLAGESFTSSVVYALRSAYDERHKIGVAYMDMSGCEECSEYYEFGILRRLPCEKHYRAHYASHGIPAPE
jgi:hypothetical protein